MTEVQLTIYIPTWNRPASCLDQIRQLAQQRSKLESDSTVTIVVAINGDPQYQVQDLVAAGANDVVARRVNLGGDANICLAYEHLPSTGYLWLLSDDDPVRETALASILDVLERNSDVDLLLLSESDKPMARQVDVPETIEQLEDVPAASISAAIYRGDAFVGSVEHAFRAIVSWFPHVALIDHALSAGTVRTIWTLPLHQVIDLSLMRREANSLGRSAMGRRTGSYFFGGAILAYLDKDRERSVRRTRAWWRTHWHRLSMYRLANSVEGELVDALGRSAFGTFWWWLLSLAPWWKLKDRFVYGQGPTDVVHPISAHESTPDPHRG